MDYTIFILETIVNDIFSSVSAPKRYRAYGQFLLHANSLPLDPWYGYYHFSYLYWSIIITITFSIFKIIQNQCETWKVQKEKYINVMIMFLHMKSRKFTRVYLGIGQTMF